MNRINNTAGIADTSNHITGNASNTSKNSNNSSVKTLQAGQRYDWHASAGSFLYLASGSLTINRTICAADGYAVPASLRLLPEDYYLIADSGWLQLEAHAICDIRMEENEKNWLQQYHRGWRALCQLIRRVGLTKYRQSTGIPEKNASLKIL